MHASLRGGEVLVPDMHVQSAGLVQCNNIVPAEKLVSNVKIAGDFCSRRPGCYTACRRTYLRYKYSVELSLCTYQK